MFYSRGTNSDSCIIDERLGETRHHSRLLRLRESRDCNGNWEMDYEHVGSLTFVRIFMTLVFFFNGVASWSLRTSSNLFLHRLLGVKCHISKQPLLTFVWKLKVSSKAAGRAVVVFLLTARIH